MTTWKLVPVEPTDEMTDAAYNQYSSSDAKRTTYCAMTAAAPDIPDAVVERVARAICRMVNDDYSAVQIDHAWTAYVGQARAAIAAISGDQ